MNFISKMKLNRLLKQNYVCNNLTPKQIKAIKRLKTKLYQTTHYKRVWRYRDRVKAWYAPISQAVKHQVTNQPRYSTQQTIQIMQKLIKKIKNNFKTITRNQLVKIFYTAKYSNLHTDYPTRLGQLKDPIEINDGDNGDNGVFNSFNEAGQRLTISPLLSDNPKINARYERYNIRHRNDPNLIFPQELIDNLRDVINSIKSKVYQAKIYNQSKHIITTKNNVKGAKSIKPVSTDFNEKQKPLDFKLGVLKEKAINNHLNAVINIHIKYDKHVDDVLGKSGRIHADLAKVKDN